MQPTNPGTTGDATALIASCAGQVNAYIAMDSSGSNRDIGLGQARRNAVERELSRVAACGGRAKIVAFASSSAASSTLFDGTIPLRGTTSQARARHLHSAVTPILGKIAETYGTANSALDLTGSDPIAQLGLFAEWVGQLPDSGDSHLLVLTDGFQNRGVPTDEIIADPTTAAGSFDAPDLHGSHVTFAGIGDVAGATPSTEIVDRLKSFYLALCERTGARSCTVVSEVVS